jgi:hypothetical protein
MARNPSDSGDLNHGCNGGQHAGIRQEIRKGMVLLYERI